MRADHERNTRQPGRSSGPFVVDRPSVSEGADGALGVSSDAKDSPKRGAWAVGEERTN